MSFLSERKNEITEHTEKSSCCRRAILFGILFSKGVVSGGKIEIRLENTNVALYAATLIKEFFGKEPDICSSRTGGRCKFLTFSSPAAERYLNSLENQKAAYFTEKCQGCKSAFVRGIFLACGRVTNPKKQYRIELAPSSRHEIMKNILASMDIKFSLAKRRAELLLYTGNSAVAEDFFAVAGMNTTAFLLMNSKIESEFKNNANRVRNCETNNILKSVSASAKWVEAIEALEEANLLSTLPDELEKTARLRLEYKDYSLARLAAEFTPPISKPGLSHRLNKILEISENLLGKNKD